MATNGLDPQFLSPDARANAIALLRAKANCRRRNKGEHRSELTFPLNLQLCAGMNLMFEGWGPEVDGAWSIKECHHVIGRSRASETSIVMTKCLPY